MWRAVLYVSTHGNALVAPLGCRLACAPNFNSPPDRQKFGAGEGNRTLVVSLEGFCSTIELHPPEGEGANAIGAPRGSSGTTLRDID